MIVTRSASNAVKHGLTSRWFVPDHARAFIEEARQELAGIHDPKTSAEHELVAELAVAVWQNYEHDRLFHERKVYEESVADETYAEQALARVRQQAAALAEHPAENRYLLTGSYKGCQHLYDVFEDAAQPLTEGQPLSFQQITACVNAMGLDWRLDSLSASAWPLMGLHLALVEDPEAEIARWLAQSQPLCARQAETLARHLHAQAPGTQQARAELLARLMQEKESLESRMAMLRPAYEERRELFRAAHAGFGLLDPKSVKAATLAMRYRTAAYNRSARIEKELENRRVQRLEYSAPASYTHRLPAGTEIKPPPDVPSQVITQIDVNDIFTTPANRPLRNETATGPFRPLTALKFNRTAGHRTLSNRRTQQARLLKRAGRAN